MSCPREEKWALWVENALAPDERSSLLAHAEGCDACRPLLAALLRSASQDGATPLPPGHEAPAPSPPPTGPGRFELRGELGSGGLGVVYEAYDPSLDRPVAIKQVRASFFAGTHDSAAQRERLLAEAKAMARLSHPNVVAVFEVGTEDDDVFIVMELLPHGTLRTWLKEPRPADEVLRRFLAAGRGLHAAHQKGLVHRDFKPDNVLLDETGTPKVADFGLAKGSLAPAEPFELASLNLASPVTVPGALVGTPAYMAPEQLEGQSVDARADQFSFCVSLWEALSGARPFLGATPQELLAAIRRGQLPPVPPERMSLTVRAALSRGLAYAPAERFATLDALLEALAPPARHARPVLAAAALGLVLCLFLVAAFGVRRELLRRDCASAGRTLDATWNPDRQRELDRALSAGPTPYAAQAAGRVKAGIDDWTRRWKEAQTHACLAARVEGTQSSAVLDARQACLESRRQELAVLLSTLTQAGPTAVAKAAMAVDGLPRIESCAEVAFLLASEQGPAADRSPPAGEVREALRRSVALLETGQLGPAEAAARTALERAEKTGRRGLSAEAEFQLGRVLVSKRQFDAADQALERAVEHAVASKHDPVAFHAWRQLAYTDGYERARFDKAEGRLRLAQAAVERLGHPASLRADLDFTRGVVEQKTGALREGKASLERALAYYRAAPELRMAEARTLNNLSLVESALDEQDASLRHQQQALDVIARVLGDAHPTAALLRMNLGVDLLNRRDLEGARKTFDEALDAMQRAVGPEHLHVGAVLLNRGKAYTALERLELAEADLRRALELFEKKGSPDEVAQGLQALAVALRAAGRLDESLELDRRALALREKALGPDAPLTGVSLHNTAQALRALGRPREALPLLDRCIAIFEQRLGPKHTHLAKALAGRGAALIETGAPEAGLASVRGALAILAEAEKPPGAETAAVLVTRAEGERVLRQPERALATLEGAAPLLPTLPALDRARYHEVRSRTLLTAGQRVSAREALDRALDELGRAPGGQARAKALAAWGAAGGLMPSARSR